MGSDLRCASGNLYLDDVIVSVAHKYQVNTAWHLEHPKLA
jgi:hypothetical protein